MTGSTPFSIEASNNFKRSFKNLQTDINHEKLCNSICRVRRHLKFINSIENFMATHLTQLLDRMKLRVVYTGS